MQKFFRSAALATALLATASAAQAFPASPQLASPAGDIVQVRGLCGLGWHRGFYGECLPNGAGYFYGPYAAYAPPAGRCWWVGSVYGPRRVCG